ncbi:class I SAM-dependent methyltransferase [Christensenellaceae bacterium OttesenSCG-928-K19]|nr:class I SAM-dependent methyltransferase [Christensenellaceae bacterium OttesenSCG-928-K19]
MDIQTTEKLAKSLTAESTSLLPYIPYLLQDLWDLGGGAAMVEKLIARHLPAAEGLRLLDLACGKGAISIPLAEKFGCHVTGFDLIPPFIEVARHKAEEYGVAGLCQFIVKDVNLATQEDKQYDIVLFCAAGDILGKPPELLGKLRRLVRPGGMAVLDESYLPEGTNPEIRYKNYAYYTEKQWGKLFDASGFHVLEKGRTDDAPLQEEQDHQLACIGRRVEELSAQHPQEAALFQQYLHSQQNESFDLVENLENAVWLLQRQ